MQVSPAAAFQPLTRGAGSFHASGIQPWRSRPFSSRRTRMTRWPRLRDGLARITASRRFTSHSCRSTWVRAPPRRSPQLGGAGHRLASRLVGMVGRHGGCFATAHRALSLELQPPTRKFVVALHAARMRHSWSAADGNQLLGLFLSAAQEHPEVLFLRMLGNRPGHQPAPGPARRSGQGLRRGGAHSSRRQALHLAGTLGSRGLRRCAGPKLNPGDVVVMSGSATGISAHLALRFAPFAPRLSFLGRTQLSASAPDEPRAREIAQTVHSAHLRNLGHVSLPAM